MDEYDRASALQQYHEMYERHEHRGSCYYCGAPDASDDHVPPLATLHKLRGFNSHVKLLLVRACISCNATLGDMPLMTPVERRDYIQQVFLPNRIDSLKLKIATTVLQLENMEKELAGLILLPLRNGDRVRFNEASVGDCFLVPGSADLHVKNSEFTYKRGGQAYVADVDAEVIIWNKEQR
jgi:hypothetical protein